MTYIASEGYVRQEDQRPMILKGKVRQHIADQGAKRRDLTSPLGEPLTYRVGCEPRLEELRSQQVVRVRSAITVGPSCTAQRKEVLKLRSDGTLPRWLLAVAQGDYVKDVTLIAKVLTKKVFSRDALG